MLRWTPFPSQYYNGGYSVKLCLRKYPNQIPAPEIEIKKDVKIRYTPMLCYAMLPDATDALPSSATTTNTRTNAPYDAETLCLCDVLLQPSAQPSPAQPPSLSPQPQKLKRRNTAQARPPHPLTPKPGEASNAVTHKAECQGVEESCAADNG